MDARTRFRVIRGGLSGPPWSAMAQRTASGTPPSNYQPPENEAEMRARLVYWVKDRMGKVGIDSIRKLAAEMGIPNSTVARWFGGKETGGVPLIWLGELCRVLKVDPVWFLTLDPIPVEEANPNALPDGDPLLDMLVAARLARQDAAAAVAEAQRAGVQPRAPRRKRAASGGH